MTRSSSGILFVPERSRYLRLAGRSPMAILPCHVTALPSGMVKLREYGLYHRTRTGRFEGEARIHTIMVSLFEPSTHSGPGVMDGKHPVL